MHGRCFGEFVVFRPDAAHRSPVSQQASFQKLQSCSHSKGALSSSIIDSTLSLSDCCSYEARYQLTTTTRAELSCSRAKTSSHFQSSSTRLIGATAVCPASNQSLVILALRILCPYLPSFCGSYLIDQKISQNVALLPNDGCCAVTRASAQSAHAMQADSLAGKSHLSGGSALKPNKM